MTKEDQFEWLEKHSMEFFMRDILVGISASVKSAEKFGYDFSLKDSDFLSFENHELNLKNILLDDLSIEESGFLDVRIIDYAPRVFAKLRLLEDLEPEEMSKSFLPKNNTEGIKESQGKSGSFFISTDDNKFMIKTLKADEFELIRGSFLRKYNDYITNNSNSLLCRIYGMYNIIMSGGSEILVIVMRNIIGDFKENVVCKFDLKGSKDNRKIVSRTINDIEKSVMKDLNFDEYEKVLMLSNSSQQKLKRTAAKDSSFLCSLELMDYSLFVVKLTMSQREVRDLFGENIQEKQENDVNNILAESGRSSLSSSGNRSSYCGEGKLHDVKYYRNYLYPSLNSGLVYLIAIIDFLQYFNFFKLVENTYKKTIKRGRYSQEISCVEPKIYSERFLHFINQITDVKSILKNTQEIKKDIIIADIDEEGKDGGEEDDILNDGVQKSSLMKKFSRTFKSKLELFKNGSEFPLCESDEEDEGTLKGNSEYLGKLKFDEF